MAVSLEMNLLTRLVHFGIFARKIMADPNKLRIAIVLMGSK
ncbi:hypothetical protein BP1258A_4428 [Burkholderia pseudomallei 1258a]|uniref:Uncharacterized protein n=1 Tax=Burkholderia pseudomallei (strain 1026b) TaxID=884204 RepID=A0A0H3HWG9_BURP2|nr:hypothetical protein BP1026B_II1952 [Burkholderia pseudomallei 1026b]EIF56493.1 hypothetical protein BP1258B_5104 [Burkholderia pseudomallei 1258b]EIF57170.1 hypothetical protein BP1258A_4428 [Burkholderia pseudomallei 1258a]EIF57845.1 hypothetical protein BP1026A_3640 [Burkholderia pseudomallei 1026a]EIF72259.1 hypothetical protein BP354E_4382 [Burkholderia pseudomallei 354e]EIF74816.1 hypothetical protein BP354A_5172 [Burkholderia pseudomallei 354a]